MRIFVRHYKGGPQWEYDIRVILPNRPPIRERRLSPMPSESATRRWAEARALQLLEESAQPVTPRREPAPTLAEFAPRWIDGYACAEKRQKASEINTKRSIVRVHLIPWRGKTPLDCLTAADVLELKQALAGRSAKTMNNILAVLRRMLTSAVEWGILERMPCPVYGVRLPRRQDHPFYDFEEYGRLRAAAPNMDQRAELIVLLGGDAGLRMGEMLELRFSDVNQRTGLLTVARAVWHDQVGTPKGGVTGRIPMTSRLALALRTHRHLKGELVLCSHDGTRLSVQTVRSLFGSVCRLAGVEDRGVHTLRHTFCSHLAMRGALPIEIQALARHKHIETTMGYMHLSPDRPVSAIRRLERPELGEKRETGFGSDAK